MIRPFWFACFVMGCLFLTVLPAIAQEDVLIPIDSGVIGVHVGFTTAENAATAKTADGLSYQFTGDWITMRRHFSVGVIIGSLNQQQEANGYRNNLNSVPIYITAKFWYGKEQGRLYGYAGVGLGGYNSSIESLELATDDFKRDKTSGFSLAVPVGAAVFVSRRLFLSASYQFSWLNDSFYTNDIAHLFIVGVNLTVGIGN